MIGICLQFLHVYDWQAFQIEWNVRSTWTFRDSKSCVDSRVRLIPAWKWGPAVVFWNRPTSSCCWPDKCWWRRQITAPLTMRETHHCRIYIVTCDTKATHASFCLILTAGHWTSSHSVGNKTCQKCLFVGWSLNGNNHNSEEFNKRTRFFYSDIINSVLFISQFGTL